MSFHIAERNLKQNIAWEFNREFVVFNSIEEFLFEIFKGLLNMIQILSQHYTSSLALKMFPSANSCTMLRQLPRNLQKNCSKTLVQKFYS